LLALVAAVASGQSWVVQNTYLFPNNCSPQYLVRVASWAADVCAPGQTSGSTKRTCNSTHVVSNQYSDSTCQTVTSSKVFPANLCGTDSLNQGLFFGCPSQATPPVLSNQNNDVYVASVYLKGASNCDDTKIYQTLSAQSGVCASGENYTCFCSGGTCGGPTISTPCGSPAAAQRLSCSAGGNLDSRVGCQQAITPTQPPVNPQAPPGGDPSTVAPCSAATTFNQCVGIDPIPASGFPTIPTSSLISKCCVWCQQAGGASQCSEPGFSTKTCSCPSNTTAFTTLAQIYQCGTGTVQMGCACSGRPLGSAPCSNYQGTQGGVNAFAAALSASWALVVLALVLGFAL